MKSDISNWLNPVFCHGVGFRGFLVGGSSLCFSFVLFMNIFKWGGFHMKTRTSGFPREVKISGNTGQNFLRAILLEQTGRDPENGG